MLTKFYFLEKILEKKNYTINKKNFSFKNLFFIILELKSTIKNDILN